MTFALALATALSLAFTDVRTGKMPNWLTLSSLGVAFGVRWLVEGRGGVVAALLGVVVVAAIPLGLFLFTRGKAIGGGDVKALGALGAWLGPMAGIEAEMLGFLFLAVFALVWEGLRGQGMALLCRSFALLVPRWGLAAAGQGEPENLEMRFGPALLFGTLVVCAARVSGA
jgi:prepilin peptidase CpaA